MKNIAIPTNNTGNEVQSRGQNAAYCKHVAAAGFNPVLVPMEADPQAIVEFADGLLLAGGIDIDPLYYGMSNACSMNVDPEKDDFERRLFHKFREYNRPVFGICRGFQLIFREFLNCHPHNEQYNKYFDYLENVERHNQTTGLSVARRFASHLVRANVSSLFGVSDKKPLMAVPVNSMHHQAVAFRFLKAAKDLYPAAYARPEFDKDEPSILTLGEVELQAWTLRGVNHPTKGKKEDIAYVIVEAARIKNWGGPIMGVQWHPEELGDIRILRGFFGDKKQEEVVVGKV